MSAKGTLYLIPGFLGDAEPQRVFPPHNAEVLENLRFFIAEREKTARRFIKRILPEKSQQSLQFSVLNKHTRPDEIPRFVEPLLQGHSMGLMSEAGLPAIADPGALIVAWAHRHGIRVVPLVGPSSVFLALMASGLNGQRFAFHGYLPVERSALTHSLRRLENQSRQFDQTQIFIETPYRNNKMLRALTDTLHPGTLLCVASELTTPAEMIRTQSISAWRKTSLDLHKKPTVFLFLA